MESSGSTRKPCFLEDDTGLASIAVDHSFSSSSPASENHHTTHLISRSLSSQVSSRKLIYNGKFDKQPSYFLDACFLCKKLLSCNKDIFMYRGDTAFCSEECRTEQIDKDEAAKENWNNISLKKKKSLALRKKEVLHTEMSSSSTNNNSSSNKASKNNYPFQSGALAAA